MVGSQWNWVNQLMDVSLSLQPIKGIFSTLDEECAKTVYFREEIFIQNLNKHCESDLHYTSISNPVLVESDGTGSGYFLPSLPYRRLSAGDISKSLPQLCFAVKHFLGNVSAPTGTLSPLPDS